MIGRQMSRRDVSERPFPIFPNSLQETLHCPYIFLELKPVGSVRPGWRFFEPAESGGVKLQAECTLQRCFKLGAAQDGKAEGHDFHPQLPTKRMFTAKDRKPSVESNQLLH
jgi:hypothetical protein